MSYCSIWMTPFRRVFFRSPPSIMRATSRCITYPNIGMIQQWNREKSTGDQNCPAGVFPFVFQETSDDDFCQKDYVPSNPSSQFIQECDKNNRSKNQHDPTVDSRDIATGALLVPSNSAPLSSWILYYLSRLFFSFIFLSLFFELVAFCCFKGTFSPNYIYVPHLCIYVFFLCKLSGLFLLKSLVFTNLPLGWDLSPR